MNVIINGGDATAYDDFKATVAALAPNGADVFYQATPTPNLKRIYATVRGEPGCKGEFPIAISCPNDLALAAISVTGVVLVDFPSAIEVKNPLTLTA